MGVAIWTGIGKLSGYGQGCERKIRCSVKKLAALGFRAMMQGYIVKPEPKTGDDTNGFLPLLALCDSGGAVTALFLYRRKHKKMKV